MESTLNKRAEEQKERHVDAMTARFMKSMQDRAKLAIINYLQQNPHWTPEELKHVINIFTRKYALHNRYIPPVTKAALDAAAMYGNVGEGNKVETIDNTDAPRTETKTGD
jgi:hypothetical protein